MHANTPTALITKCNQELINKKLINQNQTAQTREETLNSPTRRSIQKATDQLHINPVQTELKTREYKTLDRGQENKREIVNNLITKIKGTHQHNGALLQAENHEALANNLKQESKEGQHNDIKQDKRFSNGHYNKENLDKQERRGKPTPLAP